MSPHSTADREPRTAASTVTLNDGTRIPQIGIGVYQVPDGAETERLVSTALELGYRHIDTAHAYQNERSVGRAVQQALGGGSLSRSDLWITSKLWPSDYGRQRSSQAITLMLDRLGLEYLDLLLLHQQFGDYLGAWEAMEQAVADGRVRSIGLSNFESDRLEEVLVAATIKPSVNQVECHPFYPQRSLRARLAPTKTAIEAWYPLGHGSAELLENPVIGELSKQYGKTPAQIILRWHLQTGTIVFPRSTSRQHMAENIDIFDFTLSQDAINRIDALDSGTRFFTMSLKEQESTLGGFVPKD